MIFLTVGSDIPFPRLTRAVDRWCKNHPKLEAFAQIGHVESAEDKPQSIEWTDVLPATEFNEKVSQARIIVAHAGMGSIISALTNGKPIVLMPRREHLMETRSDHQVATAKRFKDKPGVFVAVDEHHLDVQIRQALAFQEDSILNPVSNFAPESFTSRLRQYILCGDLDE